MSTFGPINVAEGLALSNWSSLDQVTGLWPITLVREVGAGAEPVTRAGVLELVLGAGRSDLQGNGPHAVVTKWSESKLAVTPWASPQGPRAGSPFPAPTCWVTLGSGAMGRCLKKADFKPRKEEARQPEMSCPVHVAGGWHLARVALLSLVSLVFPLPFPSAAAPRKGSGWLRLSSLPGVGGEGSPAGQSS